ncbi:MAG: DASS family sodium-coupled anion symporter [Candidatus Lokiarchaeota archaeon]|nr:DASS family sodium-coupled anion symporter [Candidatus Lokiarchaeota archaeon]
MHLSYQISRKTAIVLTIALVAGVVMYNIAPMDIRPGDYQATLTVDAPGISLEHSIPIEVVESGEIQETTVFLSGDSTNLTVLARNVLPINTDTPFRFVVEYSGESMKASDILVRITNNAGYNQTVRPTLQQDQEFIIEHQPLVHSKAAVAILTVVGILWFTEGISLVATSIMIPVMVILANIRTPTEALNPFFDPAVALILGGFLIGRALSKYELDKRLALMILSRSAGSGSTLILTIMGVSAFLSMWISNTASAAIMIPIAIAVISKIENKETRDKYGKVLVLAVAYSATVGGVGSLVGSPPNPLAATYINSFLGIEFSFIDWIPYGLPVVIIMLPIIWQWLMFRFDLPKDIEEIQNLKTVSKKEYLRLGPMSTQQKLVVSVFSGVVVFWLTEQLPDIIANAIGWPGHGISSSVIALGGGLLLLVLGLLDEKDVSHELSWSSLLILGSGIVLGGAMIDTGLSTYIATQMGALGALPQLLVIIIIGAVAIIVTMIASNTGSAVILIPIAIPLATGLGIDPLLITMVIAIAVSMDFALPTGTPPSTIAYSTGKVEMREMVTTGVIVDLISLLVVTVIVVYLWSFMGLVVL